MQHKFITDCQNDSKADKTETFESYSTALPSSFDWKDSNCDEKRSCPCRQKDNKLPQRILTRLEKIRALALEKYKEVRR